jgi:hypothetical protein
MDSGHPDPEGNDEGSPDLVCGYSAVFRIPRIHLDPVVVSPPWHDRGPSFQTEVFDEMSRRLTVGTPVQVWAKKKRSRMPAVHPELIDILTHVPEWIAKVS